VNFKFLIGIENSGNFSFLLPNIPKRGRLQDVSIGYCELFKREHGSPELSYKVGMNTKQPIEWIQEEYFRRKEFDPRYSYRAFSQVLGISSGRLSEYMSGKRKITTTMASKLAEALAMDPQTEKSFKDAIINNEGNEVKKAQLFHLLQREKESNYQQLDLDIFELISRQQYYAILNLMELKEFKSNPYWIGMRLNLPESTVEKSLELLERLGLIENNEGKYTRIKKKLRTTQDIESRAIKNAHREKLQDSMVALETLPVELRDITSITCRLQREKLPEIKELIKEFRRSLAQFMENEEADEVYNLNIQLIPLTRVINEYDKGCLQ